ncbi:DUF4209 domain-containing protein [Pseudomonas trivialis]|uniref:DUF4209 domain-containing protein n=1 Tax=Pseudomonas trivialis TaxID=200450 RepID=A0ABY0UCL6_9PSED|nr:DUF4209 domain-containing protein [Pseudomonas trivialis]SDS45861.1 protein of unknown function [Pseudomonas trivialis]
MEIGNLKVSSIEMLSIINLPSIENSLDCTELYMATDNIEPKNAAELLHHISSMMLDPSDARVPFKPYFQYAETHSSSIKDFNENSLFCMAAITKKINNADMRARLSDLVWCRKAGGLEQAHLAVVSYIDSAKMLILDNRFKAVSRIERALRLGHMLRRSQGSQYNLATEYVALLLTDEKLIDYPAQLIRLACEFVIKDDQYLYSLAERMADELFDKKAFRRSVLFLEVCQTCASSMKDKESEYSAIRKISRCHETEADYHDSAVSVGCLMSAIETIRKTPNSRPKQAELYKKLREHQRELKHHMGDFEISSGDMSEQVKTAEKIVIGTDVFDCIFRLALVVTTPSKIDDLRGVVKKTVMNSIFADLGADHIDSEGMIVAKTPGADFNENGNDAAIENHLATLLRNDHALTARAYVLPATEAIVNTFYFDKEVLSPFIVNNPFIPSDHKEFYSRGLTAGFHGDFLLSSHLLIPQIENSLRYVLEQLDEESTRIHGDGDQERDGLKVLLEYPKLVDEFGDTLFHLKTILTDKVYGDLRNQVSHGYIPSSHLNSEASAMLWWLTLRIVVLPYRNYWFQKYGENFLSEWPGRRRNK